MTSILFINVYFYVPKTSNKELFKNDPLGSEKIKV